MSKLNNGIVHNFLKEFIPGQKNKFPDKLGLRNNYMKQIHEKKLQKIREEIEENKAYFIIDDTTDSMNRYVLIPLLEN
jgi:hypothetical protein